MEAKQYRLSCKCQTVTSMQFEPRFGNDFTLPQQRGKKFYRAKKYFGCSCTQQMPKYEVTLYKPLATPLNASRVQYLNNDYSEYQFIGTSGLHTRSDNLVECINLHIPVSSRPTINRELGPSCAILAAENHRKKLTFMYGLYGSETTSSNCGDQYTIVRDMCVALPNYDLTEKVGAGSSVMAVGSRRIRDQELDTLTPFPNPIGQMLINWFVSAFPEEHYLRLLLTAQDLKILAVQFCTHLLAASVIRQIPDKEVPLEALFRPDLMYYWSHSELPTAAPPTPGRLPTQAWPPSLAATQPACLGPTAGGLRSGAKYTEAEFQQVVMGLKREHKDNLQRLSRSQELSLFTVRGEQAQKFCEAEEKILLMEETIRTLRRELDKFQTIAQLQSLTQQVNTDFDSPTSEQNVVKTIETIEEKKKQTLLENERVQEKSEKCEIAQVNHQSTDTFDLIPLKQLTQASQTITLELSSPLLVSTHASQNATVPMTDSISTNESNQSATPVSTATISNQSTSKVEPSSPPEARPGPPPPPMSGMGPPPPPMSGMEPPMSGMGPPPPPISGMGPPPPPISGMGPPPPPMSGMGPPPPPMSGMGPPPPPMSGMGPPPPPMSGMGPPPPPMSGMGPPPPPMSGMGPPPPPMMGMGPPPPPSLPGGESPPMPGMAPMPFPTPPLGGWNANRATLRKQPLNPEVPMKPLYWTRIVVPPVATPNSEPVPPVEEPTPVAVSLPTHPLWVKLEEANIDDMSEFKTRFSRQVIERAPTKKKQSKPSKHVAVKILDGKRSQNVGILSSSLHIDFSEIENAVYNFDTTVVNLEALQQIYDVRATDDELEKIRAHMSTQPDVPLDKPEQFLNELAGIPNFADRISCFMFQTEFDDAISSIESKLNNIKSTCQFLTTSESLKTVLAIILTLGNYMNGGNRTRGQADGFGLEILSKLRDVKSNDNSITLLHFIVKSYMKKCEDPLNPELALPVPEPADIERAAQVNFDDLGADLTKLNKELTVCERKTQRVISASTEENVQPFKDKMTLFLGSARKQLGGEFENLDECKLKFNATVEFFQYTFKKSGEEATKDFFTLWSPFCYEFKDIWKKEQQKIIKERTQEAKRKQLEKKNVKTSKKNEGGLKAKLQRLTMVKKQ